MNEDNFTDDEFNKAMRPKKPIVRDLILVVFYLLLFYFLYFE